MGVTGDLSDLMDSATYHEYVEAKMIKVGRQGRWAASSKWTQMGVPTSASRAVTRGSRFVLLLSTKCRLCRNLRLGSRRAKSRCVGPLAPALRWNPGRTKHQVLSSEGPVSGHWALTS